MNEECIRHIKETPSRTLNVKEISIFPLFWFVVVNQFLILEIWKYYYVYKLWKNKLKALCKREVNEFVLMVIKFWHDGHSTYFIFHRILLFCQFKSGTHKVDKWK